MKPALRIALLYALLSGVYILVSDALAFSLTRHDPDLLNAYQSIKGLGFIAASAAMIFLLVWHYADGQKKALLAAARTHRSFEDLFNRSPLPLFLYDIGNLRFLAVNQAAIDEYGFSRAEFLSMDVTDIRPAEDADKMLAHLSRSKGRPYSGQSRHLRKDGSLIDVEIVSHEMEFEGRAARLAVAANITLRRIAEAAIAQAFASREETDQSKSVFISTISHEMRTPLNAISGFLDLLQTESDPDNRQQYLQLARQSAGELTELVARIIQAAALDRRAVSLRPQTIDLSSYLTRITDGFFVMAKSKAIKLDLRLDPSLPEQVRLDAARLEEVLQILLGNALKFSHSGTVELRASLPPGGPLTLAVADQGIGIAPHLHEHIFDRFTQADQSLTRPHGGMGMGLFLARQLCDLLGAAITVESQNDQGSVFTVTVPGQIGEDGRFEARPEQR